MKIYRVTLVRAFQEHDGYSYHASKKEAQKALKEDRAKLSGADELEDAEEGYTPTFRDEIGEYNIEISKAGILDFLNRHCGYPDNG